MQAQTKESPARVEAMARRRRLLVVSAAAGVTALALAGAAIAGDRFFSPSPAGSTELTLPEGGGDLNASCLPFTTEYLGDMSTAFAGTLTEVRGDGVVLRVDRWYTGGSASEMIVKVPDGAHVALNGVIDFEPGERYLITAEDGTVNLCGYSGVATPELESAFESAF